MFSIDLYKCTAPPNVVNKNYFCTDKKTVTGEWYESSSILTPVFKLNRDDTLLGYNYCWIAKFNRWYYINNIESDNPYLILYMQVDELETYKADLLNSEQIIGRQRKEYNLDIDDPLLPLESEPWYDYIVWGTSPFKTEVDSTDTVFTFRNISLITASPHAI